MIPPQEAEIITLLGGGVADVRRVRASAPRRSWLDRLLRRAPRNFVIGVGPDANVPVGTELLAGRERFCLVDASRARPRLNLLPGMKGEITVGASHLSADQMLRDPGLRGPTGDSSYALPNGAQARIRCGPLTFLIRLVAADAPGYSPA